MKKKKRAITEERAVKVEKDGKEREPRRQKQKGKDRNS